MTPEYIITLSQETMLLVLYVSGPVLLVTLVVGLLVSIFQVVTQIQEMSLTFIPKIITAAITLVIVGPWMLRTLVEFARTLISNIPGYL